MALRCLLCLGARGGVRNGVPPALPALRTGGDAA
jgi:hypothetical protein